MQYKVSGVFHKGSSLGVNFDKALAKRTLIWTENYESCKTVFVLLENIFNRLLFTWFL